MNARIILITLAAMLIGQNAGVVVKQGPHKIKINKRRKPQHAVNPPVQPRRPVINRPQHVVLPPLERLGPNCKTLAAIFRSNMDTKQMLRGIDTKAASNIAKNKTTADQIFFLERPKDSEYHISLSVIKPKNGVALNLVNLNNIKQVIANHKGNPVTLTVDKLVMFAHIDDGTIEGQHKQFSEANINDLPNERNAIKNLNIVARMSSQGILKQNGRES